METLPCLNGCTPALAAPRPPGGGGQGRGRLLLVARHGNPGTLTCRPLSVVRSLRPLGTLASAMLQQAPASRPPRFYVPTQLAGSAAGSLLRLPADEARHAAKTLRLRPGDAVELCDGRGFIVVAELGAVDRGGAEAVATAPPVQVRETHTRCVRVQRVEGARSTCLMDALRACCQELSQPAGGSADEGSPVLPGALRLWA